MAQIALVPYGNAGNQIAGAYEGLLSYQPLNHQKDETRLLRVDLSESGHHELELKSNISLRMSMPRYTALSYPWGTGRRRICIEIDGSRLYISQYLDAALKAVKKHWRSMANTPKYRYLWVDQICINQAYAAEKNHQVAFMGTIYEMAEEVIIWLPVARDTPVRDKIDAGFSTWRDWRDYHLDYSSPGKLWYDRNLSTHRPEVTVSRASVRVWTRMHRIVRNSWWERAWVYQEFMLSTRATFLISGLAIPWLDFQKFLDKVYSRLPAHVADSGAAIASLRRQKKRLNAMTWNSPTLWKRVLGMESADQKWAYEELGYVRRKIADLTAHNTAMAEAQESWELATFMMRSRAARLSFAGRTYQKLSALMYHGRNCKSTDPRDNVFAFLGLADPRYNISLDYSTSRTMNTILTEVAARIITVEERLDILAMAMDDKDIYSVNDYLPTWVPNWSRPRDLNSEYRRFLRKIGFPLATHDNPKPCRASMDLKPQVAFQPDRDGNPDKILCARGIRVATLGRIIRDEHDALWRMFESTDSGLRITASHLSRPGDRVFVLFGADEPFVLSTHPNSRISHLQGHAMLWYDGKPSTILQGALIGQLQQGKALVESVYIC